VTKLISRGRGEAVKTSLRHGTSSAWQPPPRAPTQREGRRAAARRYTDPAGVCALASTIAPRRFPPDKPGVRAVGCRAVIRVMPGLSGSGQLGQGRLQWQPAELGEQQLFLLCCRLRASSPLATPLWPRA